MHIRRTRLLPHGAAFRAVPGDNRYLSVRSLQPFAEPRRAGAGQRDHQRSSPGRRFGMVGAAPTLVRPGVGWLSLPSRRTVIAPLSWAFPTKSSPRCRLDHNGRGGRRRHEAGCPVPALPLPQLGIKRPKLGIILWVKWIFRWKSCGRRVSDFLLTPLPAPWRHFPHGATSGGTERADETVRPGSTRYPILAAAHSPTYLFELLEGPPTGFSRTGVSITTIGSRLREGRLWRTGRVRGGSSARRGTAGVTNDAACGRGESRRDLRLGTGSARTLRCSV